MSPLLETGTNHRHMTDTQSSPTSQHQAENNDLCSAQTRSSVAVPHNQGTFRSVPRIVETECRDQRTWPYSFAEQSAHRWWPLSDSRIAKLRGGAAIRCRVWFGQPVGQCLKPFVD